MTVSLPAHLVESLDRAAKCQGSSRSALLAQLLRQWHERALTEQINAHLKEHPLSDGDAAFEGQLGETIGEVLD